ncbi:MAG: hypothetical protein RL329_862 [Bacteroidota bacterium]|jgi:hypothetical protein
MKESTKSHTYKKIDFQGSIAFGGFETLQTLLSVFLN